MSASTGPILAAVAIVVGNNVVIHDQPWSQQARPIVGGAVVAAGLSLFERGFPGAATLFSWLILTSVLLVRMDPTVPSPLESFATWWGVPTPDNPAPNPSKKPSK